MVNSYLPRAISTVPLFAFFIAFSPVPTGIHTNWLPIVFVYVASSITIPPVTSVAESFAILNPFGIFTWFPYVSSNVVTSLNTVPFVFESATLSNLTVTFPFASIFSFLHLLLLLMGIHYY